MAVWQFGSLLAKDYPIDAKFTDSWYDRLIVITFAIAKVEELESANREFKSLNKYLPGE